MAKRTRWLSIVYSLLAVTSILLVLYIVFSKNLFDSQQLYISNAPVFLPAFEKISFSKKTENKPHAITGVISNVIPRSKTGVVLVFELNAILLDVDTKKMIQEIGFSRIMAYARSKNIGFSSVGAELSRMVYVILHKISGDLVQEYDQVCDHIPACLRDWQTGKQSGSELKKIVLQKTEEHAECFASTLEKDMVSMLISHMLTPESFVSSLKIVRSGLEALKRYKNKNHTIIAFFNSDPITVALLKEKFPELFSLFDGIIVSSDTHQVKPDKEAYAFFIDRKKEYGETIIFIEAEKNYYEAALSYGLEAILITQKSDFLGLNFYPDFTALDKKITEILLRS